MRLIKITLGSRKKSPTHQFKNLKNVTIDFNHPLAGQRLTFEVDILEVTDIAKVSN